MDKTCCFPAAVIIFLTYKEVTNGSITKVIEKETQADDLEISLRNKHIRRLANKQCSTEAGIVYLDTLVCLERISDHARNIAEEVLEQIA